MGRVTKPDGKYTSTANIRLKAYEDTGLEPGEILSATEMAKVACALHELNKYKELGDLDRLRELVEADRDGRCVVTPGKVGDSVYLTNWFGLTNHTIFRIIDPYFYTDDARGFSLKEFGKTVFLTREAAEAALKGGQA